MWYPHCWPPDISQNSERKPVFNMVSVFLFVSLFSVSDSFTFWYVATIFFLVFVLFLCFVSFGVSFVCVYDDSDSQHVLLSSCVLSVVNLSKEGFYFTISHTRSLPFSSSRSLLQEQTFTDTVEKRKTNMGQHQTAGIPSCPYTQSNYCMHCCSLLHQPLYAITLYSAICQMLALLDGSGKGTGSTEHPICVCRQAASVKRFQSLWLSSAALDMMGRQPTVLLEPGLPFGRHKALTLHYSRSLCTSCSLYGSNQHRAHGVLATGRRELVFQCFTFALYILTQKCYCYSKPNFFLNR